MTDTIELNLNKKVEQKKSFLRNPIIISTFLVVVTAVVVLVGGYFLFTLEGKGVDISVEEPINNNYLVAKPVEFSGLDFAQTIELLGSEISRDASSINHNIDFLDVYTNLNL